MKTLRDVIEEAVNEVADLDLKIGLGSIDYWDAAVDLIHEKVVVFLADNKCNLEGINGTDTDKD